MEGLIPMVYNIIKKNRTRRQYESLSSSSSMSGNALESYDDISNFYPNASCYNCMSTPTRGEDIITLKDQLCADQSNIIGDHHHRRHKSVGAGGSLLESSIKSKQLLRFRSHKMFSCITGA